MDTGHITNYHLGQNFDEKPEFDSSMPHEHYDALRKAQIGKIGNLRLSIDE